MTQKYSTMSPGNPFILILKPKGERSRSRGTKKQCRHGFLQFCECWLLLIYCCHPFIVHQHSTTMHSVFSTTLRKLVGKNVSEITYFYRMGRKTLTQSIYAQRDAIVGFLSVCLSVTCWYCVERTEPTIKSNQRYRW